MNSLQKLLTLISILAPLFAFGQLRLDGDNQLFLNHTGNQIGSASFTITENQVGYGGMYINTNDVNSGLPFYGYAKNNISQAWHYFDGAAKQWKLSVGGIDRFSVSADSAYFHNSLIAKNKLRVENSLIVGSPSIPTFKVVESETILFNTNTPFNAFTDFTLNSNQSSFGGMYVNVENNTEGKPFYGYGINGVEKAFSFFDAGSDEWKLFVDGSEFSNHIIEAANTTMQVNGKIQVNTDQPFNAFTDFTVNSFQTDFGGMYVNVENSSDGKPFYGYGINGAERAFTFYDAEDGKWKLYVDGSNVLNNVLQATNEKVFVEGSLQLATFNASSEPLGTIYFNNGHFYGRTSSGIRQLDNEVGSNSPAVEKMKQQMSILKEENIALRTQLSEIDAKLKIIMQELELYEEQSTAAER